MGMSDLFGPQGGAKAMKDAMDATDEGVKKKAVERAKAPEPTPTPNEGRADGPPDKYNTPRNPGESMADHLMRLTAMRAMYDKLHPRD
jgi:hypothetical protein